MTERKIKKAGIIGAGTIGQSIADYFFRHGYAVTFKTRRLGLKEYLDKKFAHSIRKGGFKKNFPGVDPLTVCSSFDADFYIDAVLVIECVEEIFENKVNTLSALKDAVRINPQLLVGTNTSSLDIEKIAQASELSSHLVGLHFFYPVNLIPIVEVIYLDCSRHIKEKLLQLLDDLQLIPLFVKNMPAFFINRVLCAGFLAACNLHGNGYDFQYIDRAFIKAGSFTGPFEAADRLGLDVMIEVLTQLSENVPGFFIPACLKSRVDNDQFGLKSNAGFYNYEEPKNFSGQSSSETIDKELSRPMIAAVISETERCIQQEVIAKEYAIISLPYVLGSLGQDIAQMVKQGSYAKTGD